MIPTILQLPDLDYDTSPVLDEAYVADLYADRARLPWTWPEILSMSIKFGASAIHFHPWRSNAAGDDVLTHIVKGVRWGLIAPDAEARTALLISARRLATPKLWGRFRARLSGVAVGRVRCITKVGESDWCVVCWRHRQLTGVEFYRLSPTLSVGWTGGLFAEFGTPTDANHEKTAENA